MQLTQIVSARVDKPMANRLKKEVRSRRKRGEGIDGADITREALIEYFERRKQKQAA